MRDLQYKPRLTDEQLERAVKGWNLGGSWALGEVLGIQAEISQAAGLLGRPSIDLINQEEETRIREMIAQRVYPNKWSDADPDATELIPQVYQEGDRVIEQSLLVALETA